MKPLESQVRVARQLLTREGDLGTPEGCAAAAERVYDKMLHTLTPVIGDLGARALFRRSAAMVKDECPGLDATAIESPAQLRTRLAEERPDTVERSAVQLFGAVLTLCLDYLGEPTLQMLLRKAWPLDEGSAQNLKGDDS